MQMVEAGELNFDASIATYLPKPLPEYDKYKDLAGDERWRKITPRILLSHTAGFANFTALEPDQKLRIHWEPGTHFAYSGEGINLLQFVIEQKTGRSLTDLGTRTYLRSAWNASNQPGMAVKLCSKRSGRSRLRRQVQRFRPKNESSRCRLDDDQHQRPDHVYRSLARQ